MVSRQLAFTSIPKRFGIPMREIWELQQRLPQRRGKKAFQPAPEAKKKEQNVEQEEKPGLFSRLFRALGSFLFGGSEETKEEHTSHL